MIDAHDTQCGRGLHGAFRSDHPGGLHLLPLASRDGEDLSLRPRVPLARPLFSSPPSSGMLDVHATRRVSRRTPMMARAAPLLTVASRRGGILILPCVRSRVADGMRCIPFMQAGGGTTPFDSTVRRRHPTGAPRHRLTAKRRPRAALERVRAPQPPIRRPTRTGRRRCVARGRAWSPPKRWPSLRVAQRRRGRPANRVCTLDTSSRH